MSDPADDLIARQLVEEWRHDADTAHADAGTMDLHDTIHARGMALAFNVCADQLEAALLAVRTRPPVDQATTAYGASPDASSQVGGPLKPSVPNGGDSGHSPADDLIARIRQLATYTVDLTLCEQLEQYGVKPRNCGRMVRVADLEFVLKAFAVRTRQDWQPIETAPKDGTEVLLYSPSAPRNCQPPYIVAIGSWTTSVVGDAFWPLHWAGWPNHDHPPTHWMPLPQPPVTP